MATTATELERLVVTLVGDGRGYERMVNRAVSQTETAGARVDALVGQELTRQGAAMAAVGQQTEALAAPLTRYGRELERLRPLQEGNAVAQEEHARAMRQAAGAMPAAQAAQERLNETMRQAAGAVPAIAETQAAQAKLNETVRQATSTAPVTTAAQAAQAQLNETLRQAVSITESLKTPQERYAAEVDKLDKLLTDGHITQETHNRAVREASIVLPEVQAAQAAYNAQVAQAKQITESVLTPQERFADNTKRLGDLLGKGLITQETYNRAVKEAANTLPRVQAAQAAYNEQVAQAKQLTDAMRTPEERYAAELAKIDQLHKAGRISQETYNRAVKEAKQQLPATQAAQAAYNEQVARAKAVTEAATTPAQRYRKEIQDVTRLYRAGMVSAAAYNQSIHNINKQFNRGAYAAVRFGRGISDAGRRMRGYGMMMTLGVTLPVVGMLHAFGKFDDAMTKSLAIMGNVSDGMRASMEETARSIARNSVTSAAELATSYYYLASAGMNAAQSVAALPAVERFAVAGAFDMARATDLVTDAQSALGLSSKDAMKNQKNLVAVSDVLVKANTLANASVEQFSTSLTTKAGSALRLLTKDMAEGVAVLAAFADQGWKGEMSGEALSMVLRDLQRAQMTSAEGWRHYGLSVYDSSGKMKGMADIIQGLEDRFATMSDEEKKQAASMLGFQDRSFAAIQTLLGTSSKIREYEAQLRKAGGTTEEVARKQLQSFNAQMKILWHRIQDVSIEIGRTLAPYVRKIADWIGKATDVFRKLSAGMRKTIGIVVGLVAVAGPLLSVLGIVAVVIGAVVSAIGALFTIGWPVVGVIAAIIAGFVILVAECVAVAVALWQVIDYIWGPGSLAEAFMKMMRWAKNWALTMLGFVFNLRYNLNIFMNWLPQHWKTLLSDMLSMFAVLVGNLAYNTSMLIMVFVRLFALWRGFMVRLWKQVFSMDFLMWVDRGILKVVNRLKLFVEVAWKAIQSIFSRKHDTSNLVKLIKHLGARLGKDMETGFNTENIFRDAADIVKDQFGKMKNPLEGWKSGLKKEDMPAFRMWWQSKAEGDVPKQAATPKLPPAVVPKAQVGGFAVQKQQTDFKQVSLTRMSLKGLTGFQAPKKQQVEAKGVETRLDTLINVTKNNQPFALAD